MRKRVVILTKVLLAGAMFITAAFAFEITPVGTIDDDLFAPTSLYVQDDELAVLEPYSQQLKIFSADGVLTHEVHLTGDAYGLTKISRYLYLYCDRDRQVVEAIHAVNGAQYDYFSGIPDMNEPVDLLMKDSSICVLDPGSAAIFVIARNGAGWRKIPIAQDETDPVRYFSSFAYDTQRERFYLLDQLNSEVLVVGSDGHRLGSFGGFGHGEGEITRGGEVAVDSHGRVFVSDRFQGTVTVFSSDGKFIGDIDAFSGVVAVPTGITVDANGVLYVASTLGKGIRMYFVSAAPSLDESIRIVQRFPENEAVVAADDVRLAVQIEQGAEALEVTGFDFQLFADTAEAPLTVIDALTPQPVDEAGPAALLSAEWIPDAEWEADLVYNWRLRVRHGEDYGGWSDFQMFRTAAVPFDYHLSQNFPNPFNPSTQISYAVPAEVDVRLEVFNLLGQRVATLVDEHAPAGNYTVIWDGTGDSDRPVATGVYFYRLTTDDYVQTKKMVLIK